MHDVVRDVGIWIGSENDNFKMMTINGEWELDDEYNDCNALSVISSEITELPLEGINCPKLDVLNMSYSKISTENLNVGNMFEGVKKLRVLSMRSMGMPSLPSSIQVLTNLRVLNLEDCWSLEDVCIPEELVSLEILSIRNCEYIKNIPTEIGRFTKLRVLDMRGCGVKWVLPGVISSMCRLEELYTETLPWDKKGNASLNELNSLRSLTIVMTGVPWPTNTPKDICCFEKLKRYYINFGPSRDTWHESWVKNFPKYPFVTKALILNFGYTDQVPTKLFGMGKLLKESAEHVFLSGDGLMIALDELADGGFRQVKELRIEGYGNGMVEYLANYTSTTMETLHLDSSFGVFNKLETLQLKDMSGLKTIVSCCLEGKSGGGSFGNLKEINLLNIPELTHLWKYHPTIHPEVSAIKLSNLQHVRLKNCTSLEYMFTASEATYLENLITFDICHCEKMEAVFLEDSGASSSANNVIQFPKLETLVLQFMDSLTCFGVTVIEFPQLRRLGLWNLNKYNCLESIFNHKEVKFPSLERLEISGDIAYSASSFPKLQYLNVSSYSNIVHIITTNSAQYLSGLTDLTVSYCDLLEEVFESRGAILFNNLTEISVMNCDRLKNLCSSSVAKNLPNLRQLSILECESIEEVIAKEEEEEEDETIFPQLYCLKLYKLPLLQRFFHVDSNFNLPDGLIIDVDYCPEFTLEVVRSKASIVELET